MLTFNTTDPQYAHRNDQEVKLLGIINEPDETHAADALPMYKIAFHDDEVIEAWAEEIIVSEVCPECGDNVIYLDGSSHDHRICNTCNAFFYIGD